nr:retrovirus-related Pol polyprotein from transposon TNT 1-94 [Tanacetum cinerariifolium]
MFTTIKLVSRHQNTQQFGVMLPVELTNEDIRNSEAYKEYYAIETGAAPPKTKASVRKTKSSSDTTITPPTVAGTRLSTLAKGKQPAKSSKAKGLIVLSEVAMTEAEQMKLAMKRSLQQTHISQASGSGLRKPKIHNCHHSKHCPIQSEKDNCTNRWENDPIGVLERRNRTLIEATRTMLIYAQASLFLWAEAVATACYTQNRSIIRLRHGKTPHEVLHNKLPDLSFLHVFGALCYPTNDSENLGKLQPNADIGIFIGYTPTKKAFRIYNRRTRRIVETILRRFDELTAMASEQSSSGPALNEMTPATISSELAQKSSSSTPYVPPSRNDWDLLFQPMFDELLNPLPSVDPQAPEDKEGKAVDPSHYHGMIGTLLYLISSRPDIQFAICMCARYQAQPTEKHVHAVKRIFRYLRGTVNWGLWYPKDSSVALIAFVDADYAGCQDTRCSTYGSLQFLGEMLINWSSKRKKSDAISSTEAEYIALSGCCAQILWIYHFIKEQVENGVVELYFVNTEYQLADLFTKTLGRDRIEFRINKLGMRRFKMDNKKHIVNLKSFREMLHIFPRLPYQPFVEPPFEEEILAFLWFLGHSGVIRKLTDVNINKLHQPWRSFDAIINMCLTGKSSGYDSLRNSNVYQEYYVVATGVTPPKPKASVRKNRSSFDTNITPPNATAGPRLTTSEKGKQAAKASKAKSLSALSKVAMTEAQQLKLVTNPTGQGVCWGRWWRRVVGSSGLWWNGQEKTWSGVAGSGGKIGCIG